MDGTAISPTAGGRWYHWLENAFDGFPIRVTEPVAWYRFAPTLSKSAKDGLNTHTGLSEPAALPHSRCTEHVGKPVDSFARSGT